VGQEDEREEGKKVREEGGKMREKERRIGWSRI
jgi:hypothetical protein